VIGGYTPLVWNTNNQAKLKDESGSSFIFSLTNNHKFTFDKSKDATYPYHTIGPTFGNGHNINVSDNSNANTSSSVQSNYAYMVPNAANGSASMLTDGNYNFQTTEIEVYAFN
jgi:hypothetical protein